MSAPSSYAFYEDRRYKKPILPLDLAKRLADLFEARGIPRSETLALAGLTGELGSWATDDLSESEYWLTVNGTVEAGVWRQQSDWAPYDQYDIRVGPPPFDGAERFGVRMEGRSMDLTIPPGADLECLRIGYSKVTPQPGDLVIVERHNHDLTEMTCKRLDKVGEDWVLRCESSLPEFADPIFIGHPDDGTFIDDEIKVIGIVLNAKLDLAPKGLSQRRFSR